MFKNILELASEINTSFPFLCTFYESFDLTFKNCINKEDFDMYITQY